MSDEVLKPVCKVLLLSYPKSKKKAASSSVSNSTTINAEWSRYQHALLVSGMFRVFQFKRRDSLLMKSLLRT